MPHASHRSFPYVQTQRSIQAGSIADKDRLNLNIGYIVKNTEHVLLRGMLRRLVG
jgi:hypothetical protein